MDRTTMFALALLFGCGGAPDPRTEDLTAAQHEEEAAREERAAEQHDEAYDPEARALVGARIANPDIASGPEVVNPTQGELEQAEDHRDHAGAHRARAAELRAFEARECRGVSEAAREACPLLLGLTEVEDVPNGVQLTFSGDSADVVRQVRCHIAFAAAQGREGMDECALYVHGARVRARGNVVTLTTSEGDHVDELRQRARVQAP